MSAAQAAPPEPADAVARARTMLGASATASIDDLLAGLLHAMPEETRSRAASAVAEVRREAAAAQERRLLRQRIDHAAAGLWQVTEPHAVLRRAGRALIDTGVVDTAVIGRVRHASLHVEFAVVGDDPSAGEVLAARLRDPVALAPPQPEADVLRRPATVVLASDDQQSGGTVLAALGAATCIAAPITLRAKVVALLYAAHRAGPAVGPADREAVAVFAAGVSRAFERTTLRRRLHQERHELRSFLAWLDAQSAQFADGAVGLGPADAPPGPGPAGELTGGAGAPRGLTGLLTPRELEILQLLGEGMTNQAIADDLVISTGTVKFHVNRLLSKLHVANRAEAVARYYSLLGMRP